MVKIGFPKNIARFKILIEKELRTGEQFHQCSGQHI